VIARPATSIAEPATCPSPSIIIRTRLPDSSLPSHEEDEKELSTPFATKLQPVVDLLRVASQPKGPGLTRHWGHHGVGLD